MDPHSIRPPVSCWRGKVGGSAVVEAGDGGGGGLGCALGLHFKVSLLVICTIERHWIAIQWLEEEWRNPRVKVFDRLIIMMFYGRRVSYTLVIRQVYRPYKLSGQNINIQELWTYVWMIVIQIQGHKYQNSRTVRGRLDSFILEELESPRWIRLFGLEYDIPQL